MNFIIGVVAFLVMVAIGLLFGLYNAWLWTDMWNWFIVPYFNLPNPITTVQMWGIILTMGILTVGLYSKLEQHTPTRTFPETLGANFSGGVLVSISLTFVWAIAKFVVLPNV